MEIELTQNKVTVIDDELYEPLLKYMEENHIGKWFAHRHRCTFYAVTHTSRKINSEKRTTIRLHRVIADLGKVSKLSSKHDQIDHINGNGLDNRLCNLRWVTHGQNKRNGRSYKNSNSKYLGVCWDKASNKWRADITYNGKSIYISLFDDEKEAAKAYDKEKIRLTGEYYGLNFSV